MKPIIFSLLTLCLTAHAAQLKVATFDSGFGGYFTAKEIEREGQDLQNKRDVSISITHYGDTLNAPYGEKTPVQIADLSAKGISRAFDDGAEYVFIACNTASTRYQDIKAILNAKHPGRGDRIVSIIDSSVTELRRQIDSILKNDNKASVAILATPATVKAGAYLRALSESYNAKLEAGEIKKFVLPRWYKKKSDTAENVSQDALLKLTNGKEIHIQQIGPGNWVELIEHGADAKTKSDYILKDLDALSKGRKFQIIGQFCTHFPAVHNLIIDSGKKIGVVDEKTTYIQQGPLMAKIFRELVETKSSLRKAKISYPGPRAKIFISGNNLPETLSLAKEIFPNDPVPQIEKKDF